jgi:putative FmdB family regulatory protein
MPTYDYECPEGHVFEEFQSMNAEPVANCPTCGKSGKRLISSGSSLMFKGSGFYITDYKKSNISTSGNGSKKESGNGTKTEPKPEAKPEKKKPE